MGKGWRKVCSFVCNSGRRAMLAREGEQICGVHYADSSELVIYTQPFSQPPASVSHKAKGLQLLLTDTTVLFGIRRPISEPRHSE